MNRDDINNILSQGYYPFFFGTSLRPEFLYSYEDIKKINNYRKDICKECDINGKYFDSYYKTENIHFKVEKFKEEYINPAIYEKYENLTKPIVDLQDMKDKNYRLLEILLDNTFYKNKHDNHKDNGGYYNNNDSYEDYQYYFNYQVMFIKEEYYPYLFSFEITTDECYDDREFDEEYIVMEDSCRVTRIREITNSDLSSDEKIQKIKEIDDEIPVYNDSIYILKGDNLIFLKNYSDSLIKGYDILRIKTFCRD